MNFIVVVAEVRLQVMQLPSRGASQEFESRRAEPNVSNNPTIMGGVDWCPTNRYSNVFLCDCYVLTHVMLLARPVLQTYGKIGVRPCGPQPVTKHVRSYLTAFEIIIVNLFETITGRHFIKLTIVHMFEMVVVSIFEHIVGNRL